VWYAAHAVLYFEDRKRRQSEYVVWENVYLIRARSAREASRRAENIGRKECVDDPSLRVNGRPTRLVFGGVRKIVACANSPYMKRGSVQSAVTAMREEVEATYSSFVLRNRRDLRDLISGKAVTVRYEE